MTSTTLSRLGQSPQSGVKAPCVTASTMPGLVRQGLYTLNSVALRAGDRVLDKDAVPARDRGIYTVAAGVWKRAKDWNANDDVLTGVLIPVPGIVYQVTFAGDFNINVTEPSFSLVVELNPNLRTDLAAGNGSSLVGFTQLGTGSAARTLQDKGYEIVSVRDKGAVLDGVTSDATALFNANATAASSRVPLLINGVMHVGTATTITVPIVDTLNQLFSITSQVTIDNGLPVRPEWFGMSQGAVDRAVNALPAGGGAVQLESRRYPDNGHFYGTSGIGSGKFISKANVAIIGSRMPTLTLDCKALTGGSIIEGTFYVYADNFTMREVGVDNGYTYVQGPGNVDNALMLSYGNDYLKATAALRNRASLHNVIGLCSGPNDAAHAIIAGEGYTNVTCTGVLVGVYGVHGVVFKCKQVTAQTVHAYMNYTDGVIIKSDANTTDVAGDIQIESIVSYADGPDGYAPYLLPVASDQSLGVFFHANAASMFKIQIGQITERKHRYGVYSQFDGAYTIDNLQIGRITTDLNTEAGVYLATFVGNALFQRCQIGTIVARDTKRGVILAWANESSVHINAINAYNCSIAACAVSGNADPRIDTVAAETCAAVWQITSTRCPRVGHVQQYGAIGFLYSSADSGQVPALASGWVNAGGQENFKVELANYGIRFKGLVTPGPTTTVMTLPQFARPGQPTTRLCPAYSATENAPHLLINIDGTVIVNPNTGGLANVSNWLFLGGVEYQPTPF